MYSADFPEGWDPETPGSRFTSRVAVAGPTAVPADLAADTDLGPATRLHGSFGRGAAGGIEVIEWVLEVAGEGLVAAGALEVIRRAARKLRRWLGEDRGSGMYVSRGAAALLAIEYVLETTSHEGLLDVEAADEPSAFAGYSRQELGYTGIEPWMVFLLTEARDRRFIVCISPNGATMGMLDLPLSDVEQMYLPFPPRN